VSEQVTAGVCPALIVAAMLGGASRMNAAALLPGRQRPVPSEKERRTPAQRKIDSQVLYEIYRAEGSDRQKHVPPGNTGVKIDSRGRALVDVRAEVTPNLMKALVLSEATIVSSSREYHSIIAWIPLLRIEQLAKDRTVRSIAPAPEATTVR
jgi:hypothetical protein